MRLDPDFLNDRPTVRFAVIAVLVVLAVAPVKAGMSGIVAAGPIAALGAVAICMHRSMMRQSRAARSVREAARRLARGEPISFDGSAGDPDGLVRSFGEIVGKIEQDRRGQQQELGLAIASFENAAEGAYWLDESGQIVNANTAARETSGVSPGEVFEQTIFDIDPVLTPERWCDTWRRMTRGESVTHESVHRDAEGREFPVRLHAKMVEHAGTSIGCMTARDLTEEKRVETAIRSLVSSSGSSRERVLEKLCESVTRALGMEIGVVSQVVDEDAEQARVIASSGHDGIVPGMRYGLLGTPCSIALTNEFCVFDREVAKRFPDDTMLVDLGAESYMGIRLRDNAGVFLGILVAMDDEPIEDLSRSESLMRLFAARASAELSRLRQEEELVHARDEARRLAAVAESTENIVLILDANWCVEWSNPSFEKTTGLGADEIRGENPFVKLAGEKTDFEIIRRLRGVQDTGSATAEELCLRSASGDEFWLDIRVKPMPGEDPDSAGILVMAREITEDRASRDQRGREAA